MENQQEIKVGDVVELKSGSPKMTVYEIGHNSAVKCKYWDVTAGRFKAETLEIVSLRKIQ